MRGFLRGTCYHDNIFLLDYYSMPFLRLQVFLQKRFEIFVFFEK